jgi:phospholipid/cholesterol/gamma-HCH transport system substrate-binding protein
MKSTRDLRSSLAELSKTMEQFHSAFTMNSILDENKTDIRANNFNKISGNFSKISDSLKDLTKQLKIKYTLKVDG